MHEFSVTRFIRQGVPHRTTRRYGLDRDEVERRTEAGTCLPVRCATCCLTHATGGVRFDERGESARRFDY